MIETDAPWLLPRNIPKNVYNGNVNEPMYLTYVLDKIAECRNESIEDVARYTTENALRFFNITASTANIKSNLDTKVINKSTMVVEKSIWTDNDFPSL